MLRRYTRQRTSRVRPAAKDNEAGKAKQTPVSVAKKHIAKLDAVAAAELAFGGDSEGGRHNDIIAGWANRILSAQGVAARVDDHETH